MNQMELSFSAKIENEPFARTSWDVSLCKSGRLQCSQWAALITAVN